MNLTRKKLQPFFVIVLILVMTAWLGLMLLVLLNVAYRQIWFSRVPFSELELSQRPAIGIGLIPTIDNRKNINLEPTSTLPYPEIINFDFDATSTIPGTKITFEYPKNGFFNSGISLTQNIASSSCEIRHIGGVSLFSTNPDFINTPKHTVWEIGVSKVFTDKTIKEVVENNSIDDGYLETERYYKTGYYDEVNGHLFYIFQPFDYVFVAYSLSSEGVIKVYLEGATERKKVDRAPEIFYQVLSHINFKNGPINYAKKIELPKTIFDSEVLIPGSDVLLTYPSNGFYGLGAKISEEKLKISETEYRNELVIGPTKEFDSSKYAEFFMLRVGYDGNLEKGESFKNYIESGINSMNPQSFDAQYAKSNGVFKVINGHDVFEYMVTEDVTVLNATVNFDGEIINLFVGFKGGLEECLESDAAAENNRLLFEEIISHLSSKK